MRPRRASGSIGAALRAATLGLSCLPSLAQQSQSPAVPQSQSPAALQSQPTAAQQSRPAAVAILRGDATAAATPFRFSTEDEKLLDEIQRAAFLYFWKEVGSPSGLVKDRLKGPVSSIAAVGFQLSSLPIGVERGWITREQGRERARTILKSLIERNDNRKWGIYLHFPDLNSAGLSHEGYEMTASTVDSALLFAGAITAAEYFGGDVRTLVDRMLSEADWKAFAVAPNGFLSMGWTPADPAKLDGPGKFIEWHWYLASDEERLIYLLAVGAPDPNHALPPERYYALQRPIRRHADMPPFVVSWPGSLFTYFFSHCWIDFRCLGPDDPARFDSTAPQVDWWENSRRAILTHRQRCIELATRYRTLAPDRWGLSACDGHKGYIVPQLRPNLADRDEPHDGTIAPYAAGAAIMFAPAESLAALRAFRDLKAPDGSPLVWRDPSTGGYGFADAFNLDQGFVSGDYIGIDQGPLLLAIENARTGLIWKLFMRHESVQRALQRLKLGQ